MNRITIYEWQIFTLFLTALIFNISYLNMAIGVITMFYISGLFFEYLTTNLWVYNRDLKKSPLTWKRKNINALFGLGWVSVAILGITIGNFLDQWIDNQLLSTIIGIVIIGNILETLYYEFGLWRYKEEHPLLRFPMYIGKYFTFFKIPLSVRFGYAILGWAAYYINDFSQKLLYS